MIDYGINPETLEGMWPRVQVNGKFIAYETRFCVVGSGITMIFGVDFKTDDLNRKTHRYACDIVKDYFNGIPLKMRFVDDGNICGDQHKIKVFDFDIREDNDGFKYYTLELMAV